MNFSVRKNDLSEAIKRILPFTGKIGEFVNINFCASPNELKLIAQNGQSTAIKCLAVQADESFDFALNGGEINKIVDTYVNEINFTKDGNKLILKENKSKMTLALKEVSQFQATDIELKETNFKLIKEGIKKTLEFVDDRIGVMSGIHIKLQADKTILEATNGYFGSVCEFEIKNEIEQEIILPLFIAKELIKIDTDFVKIGFLDLKAIFEFNTFRIETACVSGIYPKLEPIFNFPLDNSLVINKNEISNVIKKAQTVLTKDMFMLDFAIQKENIRISIENQLKGLNEEINCKYDGEDRIIKLNCELLPIVIKNCDDIINIRFSEKNPCAVYFNNENNRMILMMCS